MTNESATVDYIRDAKVGDKVWYYDQNGAVHDAEGKYTGRGSWKLQAIQEENRASFIIFGSKYDRETGKGRVKNGYSSSTHLFGQLEYEKEVWIDRNVHVIKSAVDRLNPKFRIDDYHKLLKIADILNES